MADAYGIQANIPASCIPPYVQALQLKIADIESRKLQLLATAPPIHPDAATDFIQALSTFARGDAPTPSIEVSTAAPPCHVTCALQALPLRVQPAAASLLVTLSSLLMQARQRNAQPQNATELATFKDALRERDSVRSTLDAVSDVLEGRVTGEQQESVRAELARSQQQEAQQPTPAALPQQRSSPRASASHRQRNRPSFDEMDINQDGVIDRAEYEAAQRDTERDTQQDTQRDAQRDAERYAERDTQQDAQRDAERDAERYAERDTQQDAQRDAERDAERYAGRDTQRDAQPPAHSRLGLVQSQLGSTVSEATQQSIKVGLVRTQLAGAVTLKTQESIRAGLRSHLGSSPSTPLQHQAPALPLSPATLSPAPVVVSTEGSSAPVQLGRRVRNRQRASSPPKAEAKGLASWIMKAADRHDRNEQLTVCGA